MLALIFNYSKETCLMLSRERKSRKKAKTEDDSDEEPQTYSIYLNNLLFSLFSNCEVFLKTQWLTTPMD